MQLDLPFGPIVNRDFLSNNWLEQRLPLEPEWVEMRTAAGEAAAKLIALWKKEKGRVERYGDEAGLEEKFIQPVFEILGWNIKYQPFLQSREPDYALFVSEEKLNDAVVAGRKNPDFWLHASAVADAKAWHVSLDRPQRVGARREYPPEQIEWYLQKSQCEFGILTNGRQWRLVPRDIERTRPRFQTYLQVYLPSLIEKIDLPEAQLQFGVHGSEMELFLRFFLLFSAHGFTSVEHRVPLIRRAVEGSSEYALAVSEALKERVFEALRLTVEGLLTHKPNGLNPDTDLAVCQEQSFVLLYRLLFVLYAEDRGFLPYNRNDIYTRNRSLARFRAEVAKKLDLVARGLDRQGYSRTTTTLWDELKALFDIVDSGHRRYDVPSYNGGLFSAEDHAFLEKVAIPDYYLARILDHLSRASDPARPDAGLFRVDYRDLAIQQLGSVYEGLLELHPKYAQQEMRLIRSRAAAQRTERVIPATDSIPQGFEATGTSYPPSTVYLETDKGERRAFGSYYTPDHIVNHMVEVTLGQLCRNIGLQIDAQLKSLAKTPASAEREKRQAAIEQSFDDHVLRLRIVDPAMGSGHFLIRACQYLAEEIASHPYSSDPDADQVTGEATILYWKRRVAENCLYGVDVNPMAVELAKLALWLETVAIDAPLAFLDHHLRTGDSLIGARIDHLESLPGQSLTTGVFKNEIQAALPSLLEPLSEIRNLPSSSLDDVKKKEQLFKRRFRAAEQRFLNVADVWCAAATVVLANEATPANYAGVIEGLAARRRNDSDADDALVRQARSKLQSLGIRCFHWELAFPEVFLAGKERGFDAVIGNPPYDVLAVKEGGSTVTYLKNFIVRDHMLEASQVGKNNLYKLFICRAMEIARQGGYISFIVPMPLLGDEQASGVRQALLESGRFLQIHSFPQKDIPAQRVFRDAKLSTSLFVYQKDSSSKDVPFPSVRHPANIILSNSPSLVVRTADIPLYDPSNGAIVSCAQQDWNLAVKIVQRPGIRRLGSLCKSYQGEVNETTDKEFLTNRETGKGPLVLRGANVCMYVLREASQGTPMYLKVEAYRRAKAGSGKISHSLADRVGFQRSAPQNNYRRVIAARVPPDQFCFDTVSYVPRGTHTLIDLDFLLALLNSKLIDWFFTLGSTNSKVNEYQFNNLPCPAFRASLTADEKAVLKKLLPLIESDPAAVPGKVAPLLTEAPFSKVVEQCIIHASQLIQAIENARGEVPRTERAHLASEAQPLQKMIDDILFRVAGVSDADAVGLLTRLESMA